MNFTVGNAFQRFIGKSISVNYLKGEETVTPFKISLQPLFSLKTSSKAM